MFISVTSISKFEIMFDTELTIAIEVSCCGKRQPSCIRSLSRLIPLYELLEDHVVSEIARMSCESRTNWHSAYE